MIAVVVVVLMLMAGAGTAVLLWPEQQQAAEATPPAPPATTPPTPVEIIERTLAGQADALVEGDEKRWMAPVDGKVRSRYRTIFRNLRGLDVSSAEFRVTHFDEKVLGVTAWLSYCLGEVECPAWNSRPGAGAPKAGWRLAMKRRGAAFVVTGMSASGFANHLQPAPWESRALSFARGKRAVVAGPASQKKHLKRVLAIVEKSAAVADRFGSYTRGKPAGYRVYLADDRAWRSWYRGKPKDWMIGYERALNDTGGDVVLRSSEVLGSTRQLTLTVQHELAHVATLVGANNPDPDDDRWLTEGVAEYIGALPMKPGDTGSRYALQEAFRKRGAPKSIAVPLADDADDLAVNTVYAMGHYASACMAGKYGERKLMDFTDRVVRDGATPDAASRAAYGTPFKTVDKTCLAWIKKRV